MDFIDLIALTFLLIRFVLLIPMITFGLYLFYKYKNHQFFMHRNPLLIWITTILSMQTLSIERTFLLCTFVWDIINIDVWVTYLVLSIHWCALFGLFGVKVYNVYYGQQYNLSIADNIWKRHIDPNTVDFYIKNKHKWGSTKWLIKLCLIPYIISCLGDVLLRQIFGEGLAVDTLHSVIIICPVMVVFIVVYKARKLSDIWSIRNEILYQTITTFIIIIIYIMHYCIGHNPTLQDRYGHDLYRFNWTIYSFYGDLLTVPFAIVPTLYPVYLIKRQETIMHESLISGDDINIGLCCMNKIMAKYDSFQLFMQHLVSELSAENALFVVELIQIKYDFQERNNFRLQRQNPKNNHELLVINFNVNPMNGKPYIDPVKRYFTYLCHDSGTIRSKITIPIEVAKSVILSQHKDDLSAQMLALYNKYVGVNRLNVSYKVRQSLDGIFTSKQSIIDEPMMFNVMDGCAVEILVLLQHSFSRFISTPDFTPILKEIKHGMEYGTDQVLSDVEMKELLNSDSAGVVNTKPIIHYYNC